ncbi:hypothetical protein EJB05_56314, partial [Eragrostis curvula]
MLHPSLPPPMRKLKGHGRGYSRPRSAKGAAARQARPAPWMAYARPLGHAQRRGAPALDRSARLRGAVTGMLAAARRDRAARGLTSFCTVKCSLLARCSGWPPCGRSASSCGARPYKLWHREAG